MKTFCAKMVSVSWFGEPGLHLDVARKRKTRFLAQLAERVMLLLVILITYYYDYSDSTAERSKRFDKRCAH